MKERRQSRSLCGLKSKINNTFNGESPCSLLIIRTVFFRIIIRKESSEEHGLESFIGHGSFFFFFFERNKAWILVGCGGKQNLSSDLK